MMGRASSWVLLVAVLCNDGGSAFTTHPSGAFSPRSPWKRQSSSRSGSKSSSFFALSATGFPGGADSYLSSLSQPPVPEIPIMGVSATDAYLHSLSQLPTDDTPEVFLQSVSQLVMADNNLEAGFSEAAASYAADPYVDSASSSFEQLVTGATEVVQRQQEQMDVTISSISLADVGDAVSSNDFVQPVADASGAVASDLAQTVADATQAVSADFIQPVVDANGAVSSDFVQTVVDVNAAVPSSLAQQQQVDLGGAVSSQFAALSEKSISELADVVVNALKGMGTFLVDVFDSVMQILMGPTAQELASTAKTAAMGVVDRAVESAAALLSGTAHQIGAMTVADATESLVALLVTVSKVLYTILNALVRVLSGQTVSEWALVAQQSVEREAVELQAQASAAASDLTHMSFNELGSGVERFYTEVENLMITTINSLDTVNLGDVVSSSGHQLADSLATAILSAQFF